MLHQVSSASSSSSMSAGARKQKKYQDKVSLASSAVEAKDVGDFIFTGANLRLLSWILAPSEGKAKDVGDDEASQSS